MSSIIRATTTSGLQVAPDNSGSLQLQTNGTTTAVTIDTSQNVGIGTTSPAGILDVKAASAVQRLTSTTGTNVVAQGYFNTNGALYVGVDDSTGGNFTGTGYANVLWSTKAYPLCIGTNNTERMRIDSSGNVGIGVTPLDARTHIYKTVASGDVLRVQNATGNTGIAYVGFRYGTGTGTETGYIATNGTTTSYVTTSDYRLKDNIVPMTGALDKVAQLKPVTYTWKADGSDGQGFIAHELQEVVPDAVTGEKDAVNEDGSIKPQGIDTSFLVATLTAAIQEQQTIINDLKARIETLEAK